MRKKLPAESPNINSGKRWSETDILDLGEMLQRRKAVADIADFLCREVEEVETKIAERRGQSLCG
jgi:hypothetical protein